ncbi:hypothetical protein FB446DRAFT_707896 [Lentinula raphanica]|nr:hypothetical protein FB446DRAFT_707896 [Lentinula raphanica]
MSNSANMQLHPLRSGLNLKACLFLVLWFVCLGHKAAAVPVVHSVDSVGTPLPDLVRRHDHRLEVRLHAWRPLPTSKPSSFLPPEFVLGKVKPAIQGAVDNDLEEGIQATVRGYSTGFVPWFNEVVDPQSIVEGKTPFTLEWEHPSTKQSFLVEGAFWMEFDDGTRKSAHVVVDFYPTNPIHNLKDTQWFPFQRQLDEIYYAGGGTRRSSTRVGDDRSH